MHWLSLKLRVSPRPFCPIRLRMRCKAASTTAGLLKAAALARTIAPILACMEMRSHHQSKRGSMEEEEDRLTRLPDDLLHSILRELPLKHAARTSALSRRWAPQWLRTLAASKVVDLTDRDFACGQTPARAAATVRRCLEFHAEHGASLDVFRVALRSPPAGSSDGAAFGHDVVGWIASAVERGAREVEVEVNLTPAPTPTPTEGDEVHDADDGSDGGSAASVDDGSAASVELPGDLFVARNSLARLALGGFRLSAVPAAPAGFAGLRSLSLSHADFAGEAFRDVVSSCRALERLSLSSCGLLRSIRVASETLRVLQVVRCPAVRELRVAAPALESIAFHHDMFLYVTEDADDVASDYVDPVDLGSTPALRDAYISQIGFGYVYDETHTFADYGVEYEFADLLSRVAHAPVLTLSSDDTVRPLDTVDMTKIHELQLLIASLCDHEDLEGVASFFRNQLPLLDRLFVRFPGQVTDECDADADADAAAALAGAVVDDSELEIHTEFVLDRLSFIKLVNFRGTRFELQLLGFVLKRAPALEHLVLVTVTVGEEGGAPGPGDEHLEAIQRQVSAMHRASPHARLTVCRPSQDRSRNPVHTRFYDEE